MPVSPSSTDASKNTVNENFKSEKLIAQKYVEEPIDDSIPPPTISEWFEDNANFIVAIIVSVIVLLVLIPAVFIMTISSTSEKGSKPSPESEQIKSNKPLQSSILESTPTNSNKRSAALTPK